MALDVLEKLGPIPSTVIHVDFETFYDSDYTLRKLTTEAYVRDERFAVLGVGVRVDVDGTKGATFWLEEWEFKAWAARVDWARVAVNAHHTQFDGLILSERYGIRPGFLFCTMTMGRALHGVSGVGLDKLAPKYGLGEKGDAISSGSVKGKRRADLTQREWVTFGDYCKNDVELSAGLLAAMRPKLPPLELWIIDATIRMFTEPVFRADLEVLVKALADERARKAVFLDGLAQHTNDGDPRALLASSDKFAALLRSMGVEPPTKLNPKGEEIFAFAKSDPGMTAMLEHERDALRFLAEARLAVKSTIVETRVERLIGIAQRGPVPFYLKAYGAHTHRWSGGDKMNPQNFNRGGVLRAAILAPPGQTIVVVDSSQIEARVLPWFAGEKALLDTFRRNDQTGGDFYSDVGSAFFGRKLSKKETPVERQTSKSMVLGLGYSMGWAKFAGELLKGMLGAPPVRFGEPEASKFSVDVSAFEARRFGQSTTECGYRVRELIARGTIRLDYPGALVHCAVTDHFVRRYRETYAAIAASWRACEGLLRAMELGVKTRFGCIRTIRHGLVKPSGLVLHYPGLRRQGDGYVYQGGASGREVVKAYGGLIVENVVQSIARDIVAEQALRIRADGYRLATTTHDEAVLVVPEPEGQAALDRALAHFRTPPEWCRDLPLNAEGGFATSYGEAK